MKISAQSETKKLVVLYPGRFQPMGPHHVAVYELIRSSFDPDVDVFIITSNKVELPKSPLNFKEKELIIKTHGINNIIMVKNPYIASEVFQRPEFDENTSAIFAVGEKDMVTTTVTKADGSVVIKKPRFSPGLTKTGKPTYYQLYDGDPSKLLPHTQHGYLLVVKDADDQAMLMPDNSTQMSGTELRKYLSMANMEQFKNIMGFVNVPEGLLNKIYQIIKKRFVSIPLGSKNRKNSKNRKTKRKNSKKRKNRKNSKNRKKKYKTKKRR